MTGRANHIIRVAAPQHGLIERRQASDLGIAENTLDRCIANGWFTPLHPGVYAVGAAQATFEQRIMAACLAAGPDAVASHRTAAWVWGFEGFAQVPVEITFSRGRNPVPSGVIRHRTQRFDPVDRTTHRGIPVTTRERTLLDLGAVVPNFLVEVAIEHYLRTGGTTTKLSRRLDEIGGKGCRGVGAARAILRERGTSAALGSMLEVRYRRLVVAHGYWPGIAQHEVVLPGGRRIRIDRAYPGQKVAVEIDGYRTHSGRTAFRNDHERYVLLTRQGWRHLPFTYDDVMKQPQYIVNSLLDVVPLSVLVTSDPHMRRKM